RSVWSCSHVDTSALATSSFAGDLAFDDAVRAQGVRVRQEPPFASAARFIGRLEARAPLRLTIHIAEFQLPQSRPHLIFRQDKPSLMPADEAASLLFSSSLLNRYRQIRNYRARTWVDCSTCNLSLVIYVFREC